MRILKETEWFSVSGGFDLAPQQPAAQPPSSRPPNSRPEGPPNDQRTSEIDELQKAVRELQEQRRLDELERQCEAATKTEYRNYGALVALTAAAAAAPFTGGFSALGAAGAIIGGAGSGEMIGGWVSEALCQ